MPETLLQTKLYIPPQRPDLVSRPRLIERLNHGLQIGHKLTLISAPAGFGKTTLVAEWVSQKAEGRSMKDESEDPSTFILHTSLVAWVSLDENDNDPRRFLTYTVAAMQHIDVGLGAEAMNVLQSSQPLATELILTSLINDVVASAQEFVLVFDDYHVIDAEPVNKVLTFLLEHLPSQMHLVIATREDPQLPLARLRARNQLTEFRATDLRFTSSEATEFLYQELGLNLSARDIAALENRTEGWIAGLQLAALALQGTLALPGAISKQGQKDATSFIQSFTGSHRFVLDYLIEEVLEQQSKSVQSFLLQTAVLDRLTGSLCDALTGQEDGQATLEMLDRANLFVVPLDDERRWYRYHHLFTDLLRQRLRQTQREQAPTFHRRASEWYEKQEFAGEAIKHALRAGDFERASRLVEEQADAAWQRGDHTKLRDWLGKLPETSICSRPFLCVYHAWYLFAGGQPVAAEQTLQAAEMVLDAGTDLETGTEAQNHSLPISSARDHLRGRVFAIRAFMDSYQGDVPGIVRHAHLALEYLPESNPVWRSIVAIVLSDAHGFSGDMAAAYEARLEALKVCEAAGDAYYVMLASMKLAVTLREQGRLRQTMEICQQQIHVAGELRLLKTGLVGLLHLIWGEVLAELNDLGGAWQQAVQGSALVEHGVDLALIGWGSMCRIRILFSRGDLAGAEATIHQMENFAPGSQLPPWIANQMTSWQARLWLTQNKLEEISQWVAGRGFDFAIESKPLDEIDFFLLFDYIILARLLIAEGRLGEAGRLLQHLFQAAESGGRTSKVIEIQILQALAFQAGGETDLAVPTLARALTLARPEGFVRTFIDEGQPVARLLCEAHNQGIAPDYVRFLLAAFSSTDAVEVDPRSSLTDQSELVETLSKRELQVLQLISEGLSNREIADRLFLSINTIKVHTRNIYGKLGVNNRTQAVATARALQIL